MAKSTAPLLLGAGALALFMAQKKPAGNKRSRFGIRVGDNCKVEVLDEDRYRNFLKGSYLEEIADNPEAGPLEIAEVLFADLAPTCHHFPDQPESMDIYRLYVNVLNYVTNFLMQDGKILPGDVLKIRESSGFNDWSKWNLEHLGGMWGSAPEDQVAFARDFSSFRVGPDWEEDTLAPFVMEGKKQNLTNQEIFDAFVARRAVLVGEHKYVAIKELPESSPVVQEFLERIIKGIEAAG